MTLLLLDAHSHLHGEFPLDAYLEGAWENFRRNAAGRGPGEWAACLFVAETESSRARARLERARTREHRGPRSGWELTLTAESVSWIAQHRDGRELHLILGRQLETEEGIEVLQIGTLAGPAESQPDLRGSVARTRREGGFPVVPWGAGKWTLGRKSALLATLEAWEPGEVAFADSAVRPSALPPHPVLTHARQLGFPVLAGTDPLPFPAHARRSGALASALRLTLDRQRPWSQLRRRLARSELRPEIVGKRDSLARLIADQARLRLR